MLLAGCGGKVVFVEDDGGNGGGSSSSSPSSAAGTEKFEPGPEPDPRRELCEGICVPGCAEPNCVEVCLEELFDGVCDGLAGEVLTCLANAIDVMTCSYFESCGVEYDTWGACQSNYCSEGCSHADQDCSCLRNCEDRSLQMSCSLVADAQASCECKIDGAVVSTCTETHLACDVDFGCCADAFGF
jgi:hypothetical protein